MAEASHGSLDWQRNDRLGWDNGTQRFNTGGRYNPSTDSWTATSTTNAPAARFYHTAVWTGSEMIVWGGYDVRSRLFQYRRQIQSKHGYLDSDQHHQCAGGRWSHTAVWTGSEMIVWGGTESR